MFDEFKELLSAFNARHVRYLVVGGYAVAFHAQPRSTQDIDILIASDSKNAEAVYAALQDFGAPLEGFSPKDFRQHNKFFRMGRAPLAVDILMDIVRIDSLVP
jgi:aminoglycoside-2''-adenylyltransferase